MEAHSLHVGLNKVDPAHYGTKKKLSCGEADAKALRYCAEESGLFKSHHTLLNEEATTKALVGKLERFVRMSNDNPAEDYYFLFTITCHAEPVNTDLGGRDKKLEFLCLYDRMMLEHEVREILSHFPSNAKIFIILGSCYGQGIIRDLKNMLFDFESPTLKYDNNLDDYAAKIKEYHQRKYAYKASIMVFSATAKDETAMIGRVGEPSLLVGWFIRVLKDAAFNANYFEMYLLLKKVLPNQIMEIDTLGKPDFHFASTKPIIYNAKINSDNFKSFSMNWTTNLTYREMPPQDYEGEDNHVIAKVTHPPTHEFANNTISVEEPSAHGWTENFPFEDYAENDPIRILVFRERADGDTGKEETPVPIENLVYEDDLNLQKTAHILVHDNKTGKNVVYTKSKKEVNDVIGG